MMARLIGRVGSVIGPFIELAKVVLLIEPERHTQSNLRRGGGAKKALRRIGAP
jgi:fatty acid-binding protein DegV